MGKIGFLFPGQGSHHISMGKKMCEEFSVAKQTFEEANDVLGFDLQSLCLSGRLVDLNKTENMLAAILTHSVASFKVYMQEIGIHPHISAGHSLGEYSALTCSGAMNFSDSLKIIYQRGILAKKVAEKRNAIMAVVDGIDINHVEKACRKVSSLEKVVNIACYNSTKQVAISGDFDAVLDVQQELKEMGGVVTPLFMSAPFHSSLMKEAAYELKKELKKYSYGQFQWPVISNIEAFPYENSGKIEENLVRQMTEPVQWKKTMDYFNDYGVTTMIEIGPQAVLTNLIKSNNKNITAIAFGKKEEGLDLAELLSSKENSFKDQNIDIQNKKSESLIIRCLAAATCTRNYNWNQEEYRNGVIAPYGKIEKIQDDLEKEGREPNIEEMRKVLEMLKSIFDTQKVPLKTQRERFNQIFEEINDFHLFPDFMTTIF